jgi:hypothetical protein
LTGDLEYCLGIDQNFAILSFLKNKIELNLLLDHNFVDVKIDDIFIFIATELEIIVIDKNKFIITEIFYLPDFFEKFEISQNKIIVNCVGDVVLNFSLTLI